MQSVNRSTIIYFTNLRLYVYIHIHRDLPVERKPNRNDRRDNGFQIDLKWSIHLRSKWQTPQWSIHRHVWLIPRKLLAYPAKMNEKSSIFFQLIITYWFSSVFYSVLLFDVILWSPEVADLRRISRSCNWWEHSDISFAFDPANYKLYLNCGIESIRNPATNSNWTIVPRQSIWENDQEFVKIISWIAKIYWIDYLQCTNRTFVSFHL